MEPAGSRSKTHWCARALGRVSLSASSQETGSVHSRIQPSREGAGSNVAPELPRQPSSLPPSPLSLRARTGFVFFRLKSIVTAVIVLTSCSGDPRTGGRAASVASAQDSSIRATDDNGHVVTLPGPAHRLISLIPSATESIIALGVADRIVGRTRYDVAPQVAAAVGGWRHRSERGSDRRSIGSRHRVGYGQASGDSQQARLARHSRVHHAAEDDRRLSWHRGLGDSLGRHVIA